MDSFSQSGEKYPVHVDVIPTAMHTSGFPTWDLRHEKLKSAKRSARMWRMCQQCVTLDVVPGGAGAVSAEAPLGQGRFPGCLSISVRANGSGPADMRSCSVR